MKNLHGVEPTRYMKRKESEHAINCHPDHGPSFGDDIFMPTINYFRICFIDNDGTHSYECHPEYKSSLFVNTAGPDEKNKCSLLDYEVYCIDNYKDYIYNVCKYPDIIWKYIETNDISEESLQQIYNEDELRSDLDVILCEDSSIRLKISQYYFKKPSEILSHTQIVNKKYDYYLRKWLGKNKWILIYRASENKYDCNLFHECCDDKGPTLVVIKSSGGWIFGGYTTKSWKVVHPNEKKCMLFE